MNTLQASLVAVVAAMALAIFAVYVDTAVPPTDLAYLLEYAGVGVLSAATYALARRL